MVWPGCGGVMADSGGEDGGPGLLVVVVDINPNQVSLASNHLKQNFLPVAICKKAQFAEPAAQLRPLPDQLSPYAGTQVFENPNQLFSDQRIYFATRN